MRNIALKTNLKTTIPVGTLGTGFTRLSLSLGLMMGLITTTTLSTHAAIPVESRPLTSSSAVGGVDSTQTSQLWQLTQQIQKLENEVRDLRGKVETHDNDIDQLQKKQNHYTDFDQRIAQSQDDIKKLQAAQAPASVPATTPSTDGAPTTTTVPSTAPAAAATGR